jgi:hypothetical protein
MHPSYSPNQIAAFISAKTYSMFVCLVADGWCWFVLREKILLAGCWWLICSERKILLAGG